MPTSDFAAAIEAVSGRIMALEAVLYAIADTCTDQLALRPAFDVYAAGSDRMNGLPVGDRFRELLRESLADTRGRSSTKGDTPEHRWDLESVEVTL